jgi:hypothetical protein
MNDVLDGLKDGSKAKRERGWTFVSLALTDMDAVFSQLGGESSGGGRTAGQPIGRSFSFNASVGGQAESTNMNLGLSASFPLSDRVDWGAGVNMDLSGSEENLTLGLGADLFTRYNFISFIPDKPWVVPFIGASLGNRLNTTSDIYGNESSSSTLNLGGSVGFLVFMSSKMALNTELKITRAANSDDSGNSTSSGTWALSMGLRFAY